MNGRAIAIGYYVALSSPPCSLFQMQHRSNSAMINMTTTAKPLTHQDLI